MLKLETLVDCDKNIELALNLPHQDVIFGPGSRQAADCSHRAIGQNRTKPRRQSGVDALINQDPKHLRSNILEHEVLR